MPSVSLTQGKGYVTHPRATDLPEVDALGSSSNKVEVRALLENDMAERRSVGVREGWLLR